MDQKHNAVGESFESELLGEEISMSFTPECSGDYIVTVTDAQNKVDTDTCRVVIKGAAQVADFEYLYLEDDSYWAGPDWKGEQEESLYGPIEFQGSFVSGSYAFANNYIPDYNSWSSFAFANRTSNGFDVLMEDMCNATTGAAHSGDNYGVFFGDAMGLGMSPATITVLNNPNGQIIPGFYITNAAYAVDAILNGDGNFNHGETDALGNTIYDNAGNVVGTEEFHQGDFLKLTITADNGEEVEFYLADYRSANEDDWYYVQDWQYVDLSSLGTVKELEFCMTSSRSNSWGYTTPLYCCIDDFGAEAPVSVTIKEGMDATTFCCDQALDFTGAEVNAYIAVRKNENTTSLVRVDKVPANTGIVIKGTPGTYDIMTTTEQVTLTQENLLVGTTEPYTVSTSDVGYVYRFVYSNTTGKTGFQKAKAGQTISANKAYLRLPTTSSKEFFGFDEMETTGVDNLSVDDNHNGSSYNLSGQRVDGSYRGVIINQGKKYIRK